MSNFMETKEGTEKEACAPVEENSTPPTPIHTTSPKNIQLWHESEFDCVDYIIVTMNKLDATKYQKLWEDPRFQAGAIKFWFGEVNGKESGFNRVLTFTIGEGQFVTIGFDEDLKFLFRDNAIATLDWLITQKF